jgi:hypothetical protein
MDETMETSDASSIKRLKNNKNSDAMLKLGWNGDTEGEKDEC